MYAAMVNTDYASKETFIKNFWREFKGLLGSGHAIKDLKKCNFQPIVDRIEADRAQKKLLTKEEKQVCVCVCVCVYLWCVCGLYCKKPRAQAAVT